MKQSIQASPKAEAFYREACPLVDSLAARWQDEHLYEDFGDYRKPFEPLAQKHGVEITGMKKRPFTVCFNVDDAKYFIVAGAKEIRLKSEVRQ